MPLKDKQRDQLSRIMDKYGVNLSEIAREIGKSSTTLTRFYNKNPKNALSATTMDKVINRFPLDENKGLPDIIRESTAAYPHILELLKKRKLKRAALAKLFGRDRAVITNLFNGTRKLSLEEAKMIADYFNVTMDFVLYGKDDVVSQKLMALTSAVKMLMQIATFPEKITSEALIRVLGYEREHYKEQPGALEIVEGLLSFAAGDSKQSESKVIGLLLQAETTERSVAGSKKDRS